MIKIGLQIVCRKEVFHTQNTARFATKTMRLPSIFSLLVFLQGNFGSQCCSPCTSRIWCLPVGLVLLLIGGKRQRRRFSSTTEEVLTPHVSWEPGSCGSIEMLVLLMGWLQTCGHPFKILRMSPIFDSFLELKGLLPWASKWCQISLVDLVGLVLCVSFLIVSSRHLCPPLWSKLRAVLL